jgi:hypothetical protein
VRAVILSEAKDLLFFLQANPSACIANSLRAGAMCHSQLALAQDTGYLPLHSSHHGICIVMPE